MKFVNKHLGIKLGYFRALLQVCFFALTLIYVVLKIILFNFLVVLINCGLAKIYIYGSSILPLEL
jgi:hypothetical protein